MLPCTASIFRDLKGPLTLLPSALAAALLDLLLRCSSGAPAVLESAPDHDFEIETVKSADHGPSACHHFKFARGVLWNRKGGQSLVTAAAVDKPLIRRRTAVLCVKWTAHTQSRFLSSQWRSIFKFQTRSSEIFASNPHCTSLTRGQGVSRAQALLLARFCWHRHFHWLLQNCPGRQCVFPSCPCNGLHAVG